MFNDSQLHYDNVAKYKYLEGTNHIDPDDGLLYKITSVEEKNYPGQGKYIVGYRAYVYSNGKVSVKPSKEAYHIRDLESYYHDYVKSVKPLVNEKHVELAREDHRSGVQSLRPAYRRKNRNNSELNDYPLENPQA